MTFYHKRTDKSNLYITISLQIHPAY